MTHDKRRTTSRHVDRLLDEIHAVPVLPVGDHLLDEEFVTYSTSALDAQAVARIDAHLASCADCAERMEDLLTAAEAWSGAAGEERLADVSRRVLQALALRDRNPATRVAQAVQTFGAFLGSLHPAAGLAMAAAGSVQAESPDGKDHADVREGEDGSLVVSLSSYRLELEGRHVVVEPFGLRRTLERVTPDQVGFEAVIPRSERQKFSPQSRVDLILAGDESA